jgi:hypothetical protein
VQIFHVQEVRNKEYCKISAYFIPYIEITMRFETKNWLNIQPMSRVYHNRSLQSLIPHRLLSKPRTRAMILLVPTLSTMSLSLIGIESKPY